jgi:hypothetical protein
MKTLSLALRLRLEQFLLDYLKENEPPCSCKLCVRGSQLQLDIEAEYEHQQDILDRKDV